MGIDVRVPSLGTDVEFYDDTSKIKYRPVNLTHNANDEMETTTGYYFAILMGCFIVISLVGGKVEKYLAFE